MAVEQILVTLVVKEEHEVETVVVKVERFDVGLKVVNADDLGSCLTTVSCSSCNLANPKTVIKS